MMLVFGPVPSRRLGNSLGINHILAKHCSYSCVYCQVGRTNHLEIHPRSFYSLDRILDEVQQKITESANMGQGIDYLTLVPDGEPALDEHLEALIRSLKQFRFPVAVISNASLLGCDTVQKALLQADWVSLKVDAVTEMKWQKINRPHGGLSLLTILNSLLDFRHKFKGELVTETMLVSNINDDEKSIENLINFILELQPFKSYLSIPVRPPCETWVRPPAPERLRSILQVVSDRLQFVDLLFEAEENKFIATGDLSEDILSITAVHPIREAALRKMVEQANGDWNLVNGLVINRKLLSVNYRDEIFYLSSAVSKK